LEVGTNGRTNKKWQSQSMTEAKFIMNSV